MASSVFFLFFLFISLLHLFIFHHQPSIFAMADENLIQETCKNTKHYDLCVSTLESNPKGINADTKGLANIVIGFGMSNATAISSYLSSQLLTASNDTVLKGVLKECVGKYTNAVDSLQASARDLATEEFDYAYIQVSAAADYPNACHNAFRRFPGLGYPPEMARREDELKQICDVALGIIDLLIPTS